MNAQDDVALGYISAVHGLKGWVKVYSWTSPIEAILDYQPWLLGEVKRQVKVIDGRRQGKGLVALLPGVESRDLASPLVGQQIFVNRQQFPDTNEGEYYWSDIEGLEVSTVNGQHLGRVERLMETGANDVLVIQGHKQHLVPFVLGQYVTNIDLAKGCMEVDWDPEF